MNENRAIHNRCSNVWRHLLVVAELAWVLVVPWPRRKRTHRCLVRESRPSLPSDLGSPALPHQAHLLLSVLER